MRLTAKLIVLFSALLLIPISFSLTCYKSESYCSQYGETAYNCRSESYSYSCTKYGTYQEYVSKTCTKPECMTWHYCNPVQVCDYRTKYNTCSGTCLGSRYKECWYSLFKYGRNVKCGTETYAYACTYNCNPYTEAYNCRTNYECGTYQECNNVNYDCSYYQAITGYYASTCTGSTTTCDTATDYDNCLTWSERQVLYDCSEMKLNNYSISATNEKIGTPILATFSISECRGTVNYELYMKNANIKGTANCGFNSLEITPVSAGTQTILLKIKDDSTSITKIIGTILITNPGGETDSINPFIPAGETFTKNAESGAYDEKIKEWIKQGLSNENIIKNLMITFGAIGLAITATQANRIKEYINGLKNKKIEYSNPYNINFDLYIKPNEEIFKINKELTIIQYKYNNENANFLSKQFGYNKELTYTMILDKDGNLVGAGTPDKLKMNYLDPVTETNTGTLQERVAEINVNGINYSIIPSLIVTNNYDSINKLDSYYWSNMQRIQGTFNPNEKYEEQKPSNSALLTNFVFNLISLVGMFYGSAQQAKQNTQNYFSQLKYLSNSLNLINLGGGILVDANGEIRLDPIKALNNRQLLESLSASLTYYPKLYTNEELLNIINGGYESVYELNLKMANNYLSNNNYKNINPSINLIENGDSNIENNQINWNYNKGEYDLMHEIGHSISEKTFNEYPNSIKTLSCEPRADAIAYKMFGNNYKELGITELELDYADISNPIIKNTDKIIYDYFLAEKFVTSEFVLENIKEILIKEGININGKYFQSKIDGFYSEWNMQEYLMRNDK